MDSGTRCSIWTRIAKPIAVPLALLCLTAASCEREGGSPRSGAVPSSPAGAPERPPEGSVAEPAGGKADWARPRSEERAEDRAAMVETVRERYGFEDAQVLEALRNVPRHWFVPPSLQGAAYEDTPLPIGHGQTISQPYIVAFMTSVLDLGPRTKVLEIGTGSGYQAAVLNEITPHVYTIEIVEPLARRAKEVFRERGYGSITTRIGDGYGGWEEEAPFDAVIVTCAPDHVPPPLIEQLGPGGRLIIPVDDSWGLQQLVLLAKDARGRVTRKSLMPVRFVPLVRERSR